MKVRHILVGMVALVAMFAPPALRADPMKLLIAADSSSGTYKQMVAEMQQFCSTDDLKIELFENTGGAVGNLEALTTNKVNAGFLHSDVAFASAMFDKRYNDYKTLLALYPEDIHILVLRNSKAKVGGLYGVGASTKEFNSLGDLDTFDVGAAGGGVKTMQILKGQGGANFNAISFDKGDDVLSALRDGKIHAAIFVGGAPLPNMEKLSWQEFKLIPVGDSIASRLSAIYRPTKLTYANLHAAQVATLAPMATLLTRVYKTKKFVDAQAAFRKCFYDHLDEMKETPGLHPKWQEVEAWDHGVWEWLSLPGDQEQPTKQ